MKDRIRILIIVREQEWRTSAAQILQEAGYSVHLFSDPQPAIQEILNNDFDLIIIDALLMDLLKTLALKYPGSRLLVVTAAPSVSEAILAYRHGALDYVSKAFDASSILATVTTALKKQPAKQGLLS